MGCAPKRGGKREGAGRPKNEPDVEDFKVGKGFASRVFARIAELKLTYAVDATDPDLASGDEKKRAAAQKRVAERMAKAPAITTAEDYALDIIAKRDLAGRELFKLLLAYQLGKPVQPTIQADTRETAPELNFDGLAMPNAGVKSQASRKPN